MRNPVIAVRFEQTQGTRSAVGSGRQPRQSRPLPEAQRFSRSALAPSGREQSCGPRGFTSCASCDRSAFWPNSAIARETRRGLRPSSFSAEFIRYLPCQPASVQRLPPRLQGGLRPSQSRPRVVVSNLRYEERRQLDSPTSRGLPPQCTDRSLPPESQPERSRDRKVCAWGGAACFRGKRRSSPGHPD